jgi:endonuclease YncB( thermonuclease family)
VALFALAGVLFKSQNASPAATPKPAAVSTERRFEEFSGKVVGVADGDTITVMREGRGAKIRLYGVDAPEKHQPFGTQAKKFTSNLVFGKIVTVEIRDIDRRWGRLVGDVKLSDGTKLSEELVKAGMAWWYEKYASKDEHLRILQMAAKADRRGLWVDPNPVPPWEFRRKK